MDIEQFRDYCMDKKEVTEHFPFDNDTLVFKVCNKMFAMPLCAESTAKATPSTFNTLRFTTMNRSSTPPGFGGSVNRDNPSMYTTFSL